MTPEERKLAVVFCQAQWLLEDAAHDVPAGRYSRRQTEELAMTLEDLAALIRARICPAPNSFAAQSDA